MHYLSPWGGRGGSEIKLYTTEAGEIYTTMCIAWLTLLITEHGGGDDDT
jgi:hypothetical protein